MPPDESHGRPGAGPAAQAPKPEPTSEPQITALNGNADGSALVRIGNPPDALPRWRHPDPELGKAARARINGIRRRRHAERIWPSRVHDPERATERPAAARYGISVRPESDPLRGTVAAVLWPAERLWWQRGLRTAPTVPESVARQWRRDRDPR